MVGHLPVLHGTVKHNLARPPRALRALPSSVSYASRCVTQLCVWRLRYPEYAYAIRAHFSDCLQTITEPYPPVLFLGKLHPPMSHLSRRNLLKTVISGATMAALPPSSSSSSPSSQQNTPVRRKGQIRQSASRWCYHSIPLEKLCAYGAEIGLKAIDLLNVDEWEVPRRYGLICSMGYAGGGEIGSALNRVENHIKIEEAFRKNIPLAAKFSVANVITFSWRAVRRGRREEYDRGTQPVEENRRRPRCHHLHGAAQQQGRPQRLHV